MNDMNSRHNASFINNNTKFSLHSKRASLGFNPRKEKDYDGLMSVPSVRTEMLPYLKIGTTNRVMNPSNNYTNRNASISALSFPEVIYPITPSYALKSCHSNLTEYEQSEIKEYSLLFYISTKEKKINVNYFEKNFGFDDDKGNYKIITGDHLMYRYEILEVLGKGSFGQVCKCFDHKTREIYAIKIIKNKRRFHKQAAIEIKILKYISDQDYDDSINAIHLNDFFSFRKHLCLKFEILGQNIYELSKSNNHSGFPLNLIKKFAIQIAECLKFLDDYNIIHCDLKPENILLMNGHSYRIKVIDFGSACFTDERLYSYIQSRFYRAPEIILGIPYSCSIDV